MLRNSIFRFLRSLSAAFVLFSLWTPMQIRAQQNDDAHPVSGTIVNAENNPVQNVLVAVKGSKTMVLTDEKGQFSLTAAKNATLEFSLSGYENQSVMVNGRDQLNVTLHAANSASGEGEEVYLLYDSKPKNNVSAAVSQIKGSSIEDRAILSNRNKLTGTIPGLFVMQNNGEPGDEGASLWVRGKRTLRGKGPVILVDGLERDVEMLDPSDIEAITVLKDAVSTAQYGMRGGNGIVLITTKRGKERKINIRLNVAGGIKQPTTKPKFLDAFDYATLYNEAQYNDNPDQTLMYNDVDLAKYKQAREGTLTGLDNYLYPNIDWYGRYVKDYTWQQRYALNIDGGNRFARYFVSMSYINNDGMYNVDKSVNKYNTNTSMNMVTLRSNLDISVTKRFTMSLDLAGKQENRTYPGSRTDAALRVFRSLYKTPPLAHPILTPDGKLAGTKDYNSNPYGLLNYEGYSLYYTRNMLATYRLKHDLDFITKGLSVLGSVSFDSYYIQTTLRNKSFKVYQISTVLNPDGTRTPIYNKDSSLKYIETGSNTQMGTGGDYNDTRRMLNYEGGFDYNRSFGKHNIKGYLGFVQREIYNENDANLPRLYRTWNGKFSYDYEGKYLADFAFGYSASEQMPPNAKYTFFPAGSIGWVMSKERFLSGSKVINYLKLRASHGRTGWDDVGGYFLWYQQFASSGGINFGNTATGYTGWNEGAFALNNVQPERVRKTDFGFDGSFLKERLTISADYFMEHNSRIMVQPELPYSMGIRFPDMPIAVITNKGFDFQIGYSDKIGQFGYGITAIMSQAKNKVLERGEAAKQYEYQQSTGRPLDPVFGLISLGLFQTQEEIDQSPKQTFGVTKPGDIKYKDMNGDGVIDAYDQVYLGTNADPTSQYGLNLNLSYKGFDFSALVTGQYGGHIYLGGEAMYEFHDNGTVREHHLGRFNPQDPSSFATATYPRLSLANKANNQRTSTYWQRDITLTRLKNIELGYTFSDALIKKLHSKKMRIYVNAYNLLTWQDTDLMDIEARSVHYVLYPIQKIINAGLSITF